MRDKAKLLGEYTWLLAKNWILWLFLFLDGIGLVVVYFSPSLKLPSVGYFGLAILGIYLAGFQIYTQLETKIQNNPFLSLRAAFQKVKSQMPELIDEMRRDVLDKGNKNIREFFLTRHGWVVNMQANSLCYYLDDHEDLINMMQVLENYGFITDVTDSHLTKYRMTEVFIELLKTG